MEYEVQKEINRLNSKINQLEMDLEAQHQHNRAMFARFNERLTELETAMANNARKKSRKTADKTNKSAKDWDDSEFAPGKISAPAFEHITAASILSPEKPKGRQGQHFEPFVAGHLRPNEKPIISLGLRQQQAREEQAFVPVPIPVPMHQAPPPPPKPKKTFTEEYNDIGAAQGIGGEEFAQKFSVRAFSCANMGVRMTRKEAAPIFTDAPTAFKGDFWAVQLKDKRFAVMPNPMLMYDENRHRAGGLVDAFSSNYRGGIFSRVQLVRPAVFTAEGYVWKIVSRGEIKLTA